MSKKRQRNGGGNRRNKPNNGVSRTIRRAAPLAQTQVIHNKGVMRELRVKHKEFVTDIWIPEEAGVIQKLEVNPGLPDAFPWLSQIAQRFESYRFQTLKFHYVPAVPTTTSGTFAICPDYDAADDNTLATKSELMSFEDSARGTWWTPFTMSCTKRNLSKTKEHFVRGQALDPNLDIKTYDVANLWLWKSGAIEEPGGELWVEYDVQLITPQKKHEADPLQVKALEAEIQVHNNDGVTQDFLSVVYETGRKLLFGDEYNQTWFKQGSDESPLGSLLMRDPGSYLLDITSKDGEPYIPPSSEVTLSAVTTNRGGFVQNLTSLVTTFGVAYQGLFDVYETASSVFSNVFINLVDQLKPSTLGVNTYLLYLWLLLPTSQLAKGRVERHKRWRTSVKCVSGKYVPRTLKVETVQTAPELDIGEPTEKESDEPCTCRCSKTT